MDVVHKKTGRMAESLEFGSGDRISPSALRASVALAANRDACVAAAAGEPASSQIQRSCQDPKMKRPALFEGRPFFILVAGARLSNYMQIEIEPFPLVA